MPKLARSLVLAASLTAGLAHAQAPVGDYHQHLFSAADIALAGPQSSLQPLDAKDVIALLDAAGIHKATLLSLAYMVGKPGRAVDDELGQVRRENDWTAAQAARYPGRLVAFCSFNPLKDYALQELKRCAESAHMARGIKLHFGNSDIQLDDPTHVARQARIFIEQVLPAAPDVTVQVAHFGGTGPGYEDPPSREAMAVMAAAVARHDPQTRNLYFDVVSIVDRGIKPELAKLVADTIRQVGTDKVLYGTDSAQGGNLRPSASWEAFRKLPLTEADFARIAGNVPPYFR